MTGFLVATGILATFLLLGWSYGRVLSGGSGMNMVKRRILTYSSLFAAGMIYSMWIASELNWSDGLMFSVIGAWGVLVALLGWKRHHEKVDRPPCPRR